VSSGHRSSRDGSRSSCRSNDVGSGSLENGDGDDSGRGIERVDGSTAIAGDNSTAVTSNPSLPSPSNESGLAVDAQPAFDYEEGDGNAAARGSGKYIFNYLLHI